MGALLLSFEDHSSVWTQPQMGVEIVDIRVSTSSRLHFCALLAFAETGQFYLYTLPEDEDGQLVVRNVTTMLQDTGLPDTFVVEYANNSPMIEIFDDDLQSVENLELEGTKGLPGGRVVQSGHCTHSFEVWNHHLSAIVIEGKGLWVEWGRSDNRFSEFPTLIWSFCILALVMSIVVVRLYIHIWRPEK